MAVAVQMAKFTNKNPIDFVLTLGDNFYFDGVKSVDDPRFKETSSRVFYQSSLAVDWYIVAGNHDYKGNISAQIAYTKVSKTWADYLIVAGHYPVISAGLHGPTLALERRLMPMLHQNQVTAYFSGHDHNLQHLERKNRWSTVSYFVSGAANFIEVSMKHEGDILHGVLKFHWAKKLALGAFSHVRVTDKVRTFGFYESIGKKLYKHTMLPRDLK